LSGPLVGTPGLYELPGPLVGLTATLLLGEPPRLPLVGLVLVLSEGRLLLGLLVGGGLPGLLLGDMLLLELLVGGGLPGPLTGPLVGGALPLLLGMEPPLGALDGPALLRPLERGPPAGLLLPPGLLLRLLVDGALLPALPGLLMALLGLLLVPVLAALPALPLRPLADDAALPVLLGP
jgi:hypothetical protein